MSNIIKLKELSEKKEYERSRPYEIEEERSTDNIQQDYVPPTYDFGSSDDREIPDDILEWASDKTDDELKPLKPFFDTRNWASIRIAIDPEGVKKRLWAKHNIKEEKPKEDTRTFLSYHAPESPVTKKQLRYQRINEIPTRYPSYKEVLEREGCDLETLQYRMRENEEYEPFSRDTSKFDPNCHPSYGFMDEDERDLEFIAAVDYWLHPPKWFRHTDRNKKMFRRARIRADAIGANYIDWVAAMYEHWGAGEIMYTHINNKWGEEIYERWIKKGKPYIPNLGAIRMQYYYIDKFKDDKKRPFTNYKARREAEDRALYARLEEKLKNVGT